MSRVLDNFLLFSCLAAFEWDCARGGGFDRLNVFTPAARLLHRSAPANGPAARLIS